MKFSLSKTWEIAKSPGVMAVIAFISFAFALYTYLVEKKPILLVKTEAVSSVFSVLQPVGGLQIAYANQDLRTSKQSLWVVTASISNVGAAGIKKGDYDELIPFGLSVSGGRVVETPVVTSDNRYLQENLKPSIVSNNVVFSPVILEPHDSFRVRLLVLGPEGTVPSIKGMAKIAGLSGIEYATPDAPESVSRKLLLRRLWDNDLTAAEMGWWVFDGVSGVFGLVWTFMIFGAMVSFPIDFFVKRRDAHKRANRISAYKPMENLDWVTRALCNLYVARGDSGLRQVKLFSAVAEKRYRLIRELEHINQDGHLNDVIEQSTLLRGWVIADELKKLGLCEFEGLLPKLPDTLATALADLATHLGVNLDSPKERPSRTYP